MAKTTQNQVVDSQVKVSLPVEKTVAIEITKQNMIDILFAQNTTTFVGFDSKTEPTMNKTGNRFVGKVDKFSTVNALTGYQYERMVNNAQKRQLSSDIQNTLLENGVPQSAIDGFENDMDSIVDKAHQEFKSAGLSWGAYMVNPETNEKSHILIDHTKKDRKTKELLPETYEIYAQVAILHTKTPVYKWKDSGVELSETEKDEMKMFMPKTKEGERQGLKRPYIIRTYKLSNVLRIRTNKMEYVLKNTD